MFEKAFFLCFPCTAHSATPEPNRTDLTRTLRSTTPRFSRCSMYMWFANSSRLTGDVIYLTPLLPAPSPSSLLPPAGRGPEDRRSAASATAFVLFVSASTNVAAHNGPSRLPHVSCHLPTVSRSPSLREGVPRACSILRRHLKIHQGTPKYTKVHQGTPSYTKEYHHTKVYKTHTVCERERARARAVLGTMSITWWSRECIDQ